MKDNEKTEQKCSGIQCAVSGCFLSVNENFMSRCWPRTTLGGSQEKKTRSCPEGTFCSCHSCV